MPKPLPKPRKGDPIRADEFNALREAVERQRINPGQSSGIEVQETPNGTAIRAAFPANRWLGVANGNISARSGTTFGTGSVTIHYNGGSGVDTSASQNVDVLNPSSNTMSSGNGINSGQFCWVEMDAYGDLYVTPLECG